MNSTNRRIAERTFYHAAKNSAMFKRKDVKLVPYLKKIIYNKEGA
jgi:hypothetical protein